MFKSPAATRLTGYSSFFVDAHWWFFCFLLVTLSFLLLALDPSPQLFLGDSGSYLWTALSGWIPPDRSFLYGYVIRWSSLWTGSLTSLLILQAFLGAITAILVALVCRWIFGLSSGLSYLFGVFCLLDPLQLVWHRYVMTETVSLFVYAFVLFFSFLYLKQRRLWQLAIVQVLSILLISFRMSYLLVVQISAFLLPLIAFFPELRAVFRKHFPIFLKTSGLRSAGLHLVFSVLFMLVLQQGYRNLNGRLAGREPALLYNSGLSILTTWAPVLKPTDSPDGRLSELIAKGNEFRLNDLWSRDSQLYSPGGLVGRWSQIESNEAVLNQVANQTALNVLLRRPQDIVTLGAKTFLHYWNFKHIRGQAKVELGKAGNNWPKNEKWRIGARFHLQPPSARENKTYTLSQRYFLRSRPYYYVVLLSPLVCVVLIFLMHEGFVFLLFLHSCVLFGTVTILSKEVSVRYLQPMSLLTILIFAALLKAVIDRRCRYRLPFTYCKSNDLDVRATRWKDAEPFIVGRQAPASPGSNTGETKC
ncbi:MAG TPA: hypothetical protein VFA61_11380 [Candidatus Udaeobacter sp.]|nr:hypothetical protein [Candidatus Udaeobacter sp.]